jgi:hypothetical protein
MNGTKKDNLIALVIATALIVVLAPVIWGKFRGWYVFKFGITAKAKIIDITDTGRRYNSNPIVEIKLSVTDNAGHEYPAEVTMPVSPVRLVKYQPGYVVSVKYDPKSPDRVAIDGSVEPVKQEQ